MDRLYIEVGIGAIYMADFVYINLSESVLAKKRKVKIQDVATIWCSNPDIKNAVEKLELMSFSGTKEQKVISVMYIIELIEKNFKECRLSSIGCTDVVIYYRTYEQGEGIKQVLKFIFVCLVAFFGAGFSIMSYNSDVNMVGQLDVMENIFVGNSTRAFPIAGVAYSAGLLIGIIVFFNHGAKKKFTDDPTPLQVQMRQYEQEVNQTVITDATRKKEVRDAD